MPDVTAAKDSDTRPAGRGGAGGDSGGAAGGGPRRGPRGGPGGGPGGGQGGGQGGGPGGGDNGGDNGGDSGDTRLAAALTHAAGVVEAALDNLLPIPEGAEARLLEAMRYATLGGGKRLRAFLVLQSAALFGVAETCAARVGAAVEMLHAYSLVHDDLPAMDNDDLRRGKPSTHRAYDEATAILVGDALQSRAFEILAEPDTHSDAHARCELIHALAVAAGARGMAGGQMIDMLAPARMQSDSPLSAPEVTRLQALKTGRLIQFCAEAGAILGRAASHQRHLLAAYGRDVGAAFQIIDDLLDTEASTDTLGKTAGKDAASGKATLVAVLGHDRARAHADMLARQAGEHLDSFGERAEVLQALASHVVARSH